ncbi:MAG TPA: zinc-dependent metalloprotease, partial [Bacteroidia bacterium]
TSTTDGFWAYANAFGSKNIYPSGIYDASYCYGRTCTHEIGHYLGLRHIWGDGSCVTDYCNDTPPATAANYTCPTSYPFHAGTCTSSPSNSPDGEMTMNFMDYVYDNCMYMFTVDQTARIQTAMSSGTYRKNLNTSAATLCNPTSVSENQLSDNIIVYPNPSSGDVYMNVNSSTISSVDVTIINAIGDAVLQKRVSTSYGDAVKFDLNNHPEGMYFIQIKTTQGTVTKKVIINK